MAEGAKSVAALLAATCVIFFVGGCSRSRETRATGDGANGAPSASMPSASGNAGASPAGAGSAATAPPAGSVDRNPFAPPSFSAFPMASAESTFPTDAKRIALRLDKSIDLGPAGSVAATPSGALFRTRGDELVGFTVAGSGAAPKRVGVTEDKGGALGADALASRGPAPAFTSGAFAYWVSHGRLVRRAFNFSGGATGTLEVLATDALDGAQVVAQTVTVEGSAKRRDVAIYIARAEKQTDERAARIWTEGAGPSPLSSEGSGASSVALSSSGFAGAPSGKGLVAVMLDARAAMSPVHARTLDVGDTGHARLGADVVIFIGPSPEGHNDVAAAPSPDGPIAFIPFPPGPTSFGLSSIEVGREPHLDAKVQWRMYPNGLEPAPVAAASICGRTWVAYARPTAAAPDAPHVLMLAPMEKGSFGPELTAAEGSDFQSVSLSPREGGGAWLVWVASGRSFLRAIRCG